MSKQGSVVGAVLGQIQGAADLRRGDQQGSWRSLGCQGRFSEGSVGAREVEERESH